MKEQNEEKKRAWKERMAKIEKDMIAAGRALKASSIKLEEAVDNFKRAMAKIPSVVNFKFK